MLTVACVWVHAQVPYKVEYVANLRAMVAKHLARPHRFVCLTDRPKQLPSYVEPIEIQHDRRLFGWWAKIQLWTPGLFSDRVLYLDLDTLVVNDLSAIVDYPAPFALVPDAGTFQPKNGLRVVKRFNSSVMVWDSGHCDQLFLDWSPKVASRLHGDQDWAGEQMEEAATMPLHWFPRLSEITHLSAPPADARVVLCKKPKNEIAADLYPWVGEVWRAA
jgi:hypothetical protein